MRYEELNGKRLLLMSGSNATCEIIRIAQSYGIEVYATDYYETSAAKKMADKSFFVSTSDVPAISSLCKEEKIDGIFSGFTDSVLPYMQQVSVSTGLPFWGDERNIDICIDKMKFKEACEEVGVPVIPWIKVNESNYLEKIESVHCPVVVKPVDSSGSRGVYKCFDKSQLAEYCQKAFEYSHKKEILIERLMNVSNEFSAYYVMYNGDVKLLSMGDRYVDVVKKDAAPQPKGMLFPSIHLSKFEEKVEPLIKKFFTKNKMKEGFAFIQGFVDNDDFYINEIGYWLNGGFTYKFNEYYNNYYLVNELLQFSLTGKQNENEFRKINPHFNGIGLLLTISLSNGVISRIEGIEEIKKLPGVLDFIYQKKIGDEIVEGGASGKIFGYIHCVASSRETIAKTIDSIRSLLVIENLEKKNQLVGILDASTLHI